MCWAENACVVHVEACPDAPEVEEHARGMGGEGGGIVVRCKSKYANRSWIQRILNSI